MNSNRLFRVFAAAVTVTVMLASCSTTKTPGATSTDVQADGSVIFQGVTYTPAQIRARAAELDAQFAADTQEQLAVLKAQYASSGPLHTQAVAYNVVSKPVNFNLTTGYSDDCFYLTVGVMKVNAAKGLGNAQYISANSTKLMWWRIKGYATLNTMVSNDEVTDLATSCVSATNFFGGSRVEQGRSTFRVWEPPTTAADVSAFSSVVAANYGIIRNSETDYASQGYSRAVSYKRGETAVGVAPAYWSRSY